MEATQQPAGAVRGQHNKRTRGWGKGRQCNNQLIFRHPTTSICGVVICHAATALPSTVGCHATMAKHLAMAVALEEEGNGEGGKSDGDADKEGNGVQGQ
jgi:hypothetical protein